MNLWRDQHDEEHHPENPAAEAERRAAYQRGRRDERARHRRSPLLGLVVAGVALVGGLALVLAALEGSFANGGAVMDRQLATAGQPRPEPAVDQTAQPAAEVRELQLAPLDGDKEYFTAAAER